MRVNNRWLAVILLVAIMPLSGCSFMSKLRARDNVNKGVKAFSDQKYDAAAQYFEKAVDMDPDLEPARMYLAISYQSQFVPGSTDPQSDAMANKAVEIFKSVVDRAKDPQHPNENQKNAMLSIASLYYQLKKYPESKEWCNRVLSAFPNNAEAYYRIAVMDYDDSLDKTGVQGENVTFMTPDEQAKAESGVEEGLTCISKALEIKPEYADAMEYQNLLWREKAKFEKDEKAKEELIRKADEVAQKALVLQLKAKEEEAKAPRKMGGAAK